MLDFLRPREVAFTCLLACFISRGQAGIVISEVLASNHEIEEDSFGVCSDWLELFNTSDQPVSIEGWELVRGLDRVERWSLPDDVLQPGAFLRVWCSGKDTQSESGEWHSNFKLSAEGDVVKLFRKGSTTPEFVFDYQNLLQFPDISCGFQHLFTDYRLVEEGTKGRFLVPQSLSGTQTWMGRQFDDSNWMPGRTPFGYDRKRHPTFPSELQTDLSMLFNENEAGVYFRFPFQLSQAQVGMRLTLNARFKDGFAAFLNGEALAVENMPEEQTWNSRALEWVWHPREEEYSHEQLLEGAALLQEGTNVLAIQSVHAEGAETDLLMSVHLKGRKIEPIEMSRLVYFDYPTPEEINGQGFPSVAAKPVISEPGGIYRKPFQVRLSLPEKESGELRYTLDGEYPDEESSLYTGPILVSGSTRLRVRCFHPEKNPSLVANENYSFLDPSLEGFSSNLPVIVVDSLEEPIEANEYTTAQLSLFDRGSDGRSLLSRAPSLTTRAGFKLRGSSTLSRPKKGYRFEVWNEFDEDQDVSLLGMPEDSDWILYGPYNFDQSMIRNALVYELSNQMGRYAARTRFVEAFVQSDGDRVSMTDYVGLYVLMEKLSRSKARVDIKRPASRADEGDKISGGYLFKIDRLGVGERGFRAGHQDFVHVYPRERDITDDQTEWLSRYLDQTLAALSGRNFTDPQQGYAAYLDLDAWIDQHFIQEITRNPDAYRYSTFLTKPRGGKVLAGPAWDYDRAMRTNTDEEWVGRAARPTGWIWGGNYNWGKLLMDDPAYARKFRERGLELLDSVWSSENVFAVIDRMVEEIAEAQARNHHRWGYLSPTEWREEIGLLKHWLMDRSAWLERRFLPPPEVIGRTGSLRPPCELAMVTRQPGAQIYYTVDNSSPGLANDQISPFARLYEGAIQIEEDTVITAAILVDGKWSDETTVHCLTEKNTLAVTEIMYKPRAGDHLEFIELQNLGDDPVSLEDLTLSDAIDFDFSDSERTELAPGERVLVVSDLSEFKATYSTGELFIAGEFEGDLSNTSGHIVLEGSLGEALLKVYYVDAWYPLTDGEGYSLELINPSLDPLSWRDPRQWRASEEKGGSPGR